MAELAALRASRGCSLIAASWISSPESWTRKPRRWPSGGAAITQQQVLDECELHGGYGYMNEYLVCRLFADSRVQRIYGGTNEIMKEVIARGL
jgi:alkylation response protein AidB-like acyl-CoA dehydrogenase